MTATQDDLIAELQRANATLRQKLDASRAERDAALDRESATIEVLQTINASRGDLAAVFDAMLEKAMRLCDATAGALRRYDNNLFRIVAMRGVPEAFAKATQTIITPPSHTGLGRIEHGERVVQIADLAEPNTRGGVTITRRQMVELGHIRTALWVALRKDDVLLGVFVLYRNEVRPFSEREIALVENFAAQAVIAIENARLIDEQREALEQQTATADVLRVINESPGNLMPVFEAIVDKAIQLCGPALGALSPFDGEKFQFVVMRGGFPQAYIDHMRDGWRSTPGGNSERVMREGVVVHIPDIAADPIYETSANYRALHQLAGARTSLLVPLKTETASLGLFTMSRQEVRPFTPREIALLQNFAAQAVIAMENARLINEIRQRQEELRVTFENMGDGVAMFDETQHLAAWNRKFQDMLDVPDDIIVRRQTFSEYVRYLAERGEYGPGSDPGEQVRRLTEQAGQSRTYERVRPNGRVMEIRHNPVPSGGFVLIYTDITERKRNEAEIADARDAAQEATRTIEAAFRELKTAQANLIQAEKMASLGQLTAGIAHEIKNPLNFVNNFAELSVDLLAELKDAIAPAEAALTSDQRDDVNDVVATLTGNLKRITEHGKRADGIVKAMLEHSRGVSGERRAVDINALADEALNLAYHGARAQDPTFNITLEREFGDEIAPIELNPQDITRVLLNLFSNGFYAANERARRGAEADFRPTLKVTTRGEGGTVEIRVRDNGIGIPEDIRDKLFQPFFTTKPTGEGTGLGLSITYDIVTKAHGGTISLDSEVGRFTEFVATLPRQMFTMGAARA